MQRPSRSTTGVIRSPHEIEILAWNADTSKGLEFLAKQIRLLTPPASSVRFGTLGRGTLFHSLLQGIEGILRFEKDGLDRRGTGSDEDHMPKVDCPVGALVQLCDELMKAAQDRSITAEQRDKLRAAIRELSANPEEWGLAYILNAAEYLLAAAIEDDPDRPHAREDAIAQLKLAREFAHKP